MSNGWGELFHREGKGEERVLKGKRRNLLHIQNSRRKESGFSGGGRRGTNARKLVDNSRYKEIQCHLEGRRRIRENNTEMQ